MINPEIERRIRSIILCSLKACLAKKHRISLWKNTIGPSNGRYSYNRFVLEYNPLEFRLNGKKCSGYYYKDLGSIFRINEYQARMFCYGFIYREESMNFRTAENGEYTKLGWLISLECEEIMKEKK